MTKEFHSQFPSPFTLHGSIALLQQQQNTLFIQNILFDAIFSEFMSNTSFILE